MARLPEPMDLQQLRVQLARSVRLEGTTAPATIDLRRQYEVARTAHVIADRLAGMGQLTTSEIATLTALIEASADAAPSPLGTPEQRQDDPDSEPLFMLDGTGELVVPSTTPQNGAEPNGTKPARRRRAAKIQRQDSPDSCSVVGCTEPADTLAGTCYAHSGSEAGF